MADKFITADAAAAELGISRATLYAYVSRGLVRTSGTGDDPRRRLYSVHDIEALKKRKSVGRKPKEAAAQALDWGLPVLTSSGGGTVGISALVAVVWATGHLGTVHWPGPGQWWLYLGGPLGAAITGCAAWAIRHLGTFALTLGVVVGQMATAVLVDLATGVGGRWTTYLAVGMITGATVLVVLPRRVVAVAR